MLRRLDRWFGGGLAVLTDAYETFREARGTEAAAGMAYYVLFSLFPLLLVLVAAGAYVLDAEIVRDAAVSVVSQALPGARPMLEENLSQLVRARRALGLVGLGGALWSATGAFAILSSSINRAWTSAEPRSFLGRRIVALAMIASIAVLIMLWLVSSAVFRVVALLEIPLTDGTLLHETTAWALAATLVPWVFVFVLLLGLYQFVPNAHVRLRASVIAAAAAGGAWQVAVRAFAWYAGSGLQRHRLIYGSLGTVVALLLWIYFSSLIIFMGAHLAAAINRHLATDSS